MKGKELKTHKLRVVLLVLIQLAAALDIHASGELDTSFGDNGRVETTPAGGGGEPFSVVIEKSGKVVIAGLGRDGGTENQILLIRYLNDGSLDASFGISGVVLTDLGNGSELADDLVSLPGGSLIVGGCKDDPIVAGFQGILVRYSENGEVDSQFGTNGYVIADLTPQDECIVSVAVDTRGRIVAGGGKTLKMTSSPKNSLSHGFITTVRLMRALATVD